MVSRHTFSPAQNCSTRTTCKCAVIQDKTSTVTPMVSARTGRRISAESGLPEFLDTLGTKEVSQHRAYPSTGSEEARAV